MNLTEKQATNNLEKVVENQKFLKLKNPVAPVTLTELKKECVKREIPFSFSLKEKAVPFTNEHRIKFIK